LHASVWENNVADIHRDYQNLVDEIRDTKRSDTQATICSPLNQHQLLEIIDIVGASGRAFDLAFIEKILVDMPVVFNIDRTPDIQTGIIRALIKGGNLQTIHRWLLNMPRKPGNIHPNLEQWHLFLEFCYESKALGMIRGAPKTMRLSGCPPANSTFKIVIKAIFELSPAIPQVAFFSAVMDDMQQEARKYDASVAALLHDGYVKTNHYRLAAQVEQLYRSRFPETRKFEWIEASWNKKLGDEAQRLGVRAAVKLCKTSKPTGFVPSTLTLAAILRASTRLTELRYASEELGLPASVMHWSMLIRNTVRKGDVSSALSIYSQSKKFDIRPDAAMLHPIIASLCQTAFRPPTEAAIDQALTLYRELARASDERPPQKATTGDGTHITPRHSLGPDSKVYNTLLRALASSDNLAKYHPIAMSLLDDMQSRNVQLDDSITMTSTTIILMRQASNHAEAFNVYRRLCQEKGVLDAKGYGIVLHAFCALSFRDQPTLPSPQYYFEIVKDMRNAGFGVTVEVYTILLRQIASLATRMTSDKSLTDDFRDGLLAVVRRAHDQLTVDGTISPDTATWNQLMDTYQRVGFFGEAYKVWDMIYLAGNFDNISVSIIIDACGYAGQWQTAAQICRKLFDDGFSFNLRNWHSWLECLCRLGKLDEAVRMVCLSMGNRQRDISPDANSVRILFKFAKKTNQLGETHARIRRYLPDLYHTLPEDLRDNIDS
jgi:pentatricopeptide repeat protein